MLHIHNLAQARKTARSLEKALASSGISLAHGKALDALASMAGFTDWNAYSASLSVDSLNRLRDGFELSHIEDSEEDKWGKEIAAKKPKVQASSNFAPRITDFDLKSVICVVVNGVPKTVTGVGAEALMRLNNPEAYAASDGEWWEGDALYAYSLQGDFVCDETVTLAELQSLTWNSGKDCFTNEQGETYAFYFEQTFRSFMTAQAIIKGEAYFANPVNRPHVSVAAISALLTEDEDGTADKDRDAWSKDVVDILRSLVPASTASQKDPESETQRLFVVTGTVHIGDTSVPLETCVATTSSAKAIQRVHALFALTAGELHGLTAIAASDADYGPFTVYQDGGRYDSVPYLAQALALAEQFASMADDEMTVEDKNNNLVWSVKGTQSKE